MIYNLQTNTVVSRR